MRHGRNYGPAVDIGVSLSAVVTGIGLVLASVGGIGLCREGHRRAAFHAVADI